MNNLLRKILPTPLIILAIVFLLLAAFPTIALPNIEKKGIAYTPLKKIAAKLNFRLRYIKPREEAVLMGPNVEMYFTNHKRNLIINNIQVWLGHPIFYQNNDLYIAEADLNEVITPIIHPNSSPLNSNLAHIIIDPGHGGKDEGAHNKEYGLKEKDLTLDVSIRLMKELEQLGYKVSLTRQKDTFLGLKERSEFANQQKADLFISIHFNAVENAKSVTGIETFVLPLHNHPSTAETTHSQNDKTELSGNKFDRSNALLGYNIQHFLVNNLQTRDRGLKRGRLAVLKNLPCPGALVEVGFLTNNQECEQFRLPDYRQKIAQSLANAINSYHRILSQAKTSK